MQKERKDKHFVKKPIYPGGLKAMRALIRNELQYPKEALEAKVEGTVYLRYDIDYTGKVVSSKVLSGIGHGCDEEAQRIVATFKFEVPKNPRKLRVKFHKTIKIHFRLPKEQPTAQKPNPIHMQYTYTVRPADHKPKSSPTDKKSSGYTYTIKTK